MSVPLHIYQQNSDEAANHEEDYNDCYQESVGDLEEREVGLVLSAVVFEGRVGGVEPTGCLNIGPACDVAGVDL